MLDWFHRRRKPRPEATAPADSGPDFLCVGMEKAATGWLYDQLRVHRDFWMPPVKELRYLHRKRPPMDDVLRLLSLQNTRGRKRSDAASKRFLEQAAALAGQPRNLEKYGLLFRFNGGRLSGDISPGYWRLRAPDIAAVAKQFPHIKVLLMVRDPVERAWSHICMQHRLGLLDPAILDDAAVFARWFAGSPVKRASFAHAVPPRWAKAAPAIPFRHFFFDDVVANPQSVRDGIVGFLGGNPRKSGTLPPGHNQKANLAKLPLSDAIRCALVENLADELRQSARIFGGAAEAWPLRYGL